MRQTHCFCVVDVPGKACFLTAGMWNHCGKRKLQLHNETAESLGCKTEDQTAANAFSGSICREIGIGSIGCLAQITDGRLPISRTFFPVPDNRQ